MIYVLFAYLINLIPIAVWFWLSYLDIKTTMRGVDQRGDVETNPQMIPYVKKDDPWLMLRGKFKVLHYIPLISIVIPPIGFCLIIDSISVYKAVRSNEKLNNSQGIQGNS